MILVGIRRTGRDGAWWQARWTDSQGKRHARGLGKLSEADAKRAQRALEAELNGCDAAARGIGAPTVAAWLQTVADRRGHRGEATKELYTTTRKHLARVFGEAKRLDQVTPADALAFVDAMRRHQVRGEPLAEQTVANHCRRAHTAWADALKAEIIGGRNPWDVTKRGQLPVDDAWRYVSLADLAALVDHCRTPAVRLLVQLCRLAALRRGEALRLEWSHVDFAARTLLVHHQGVRTSKKRARTVPIAPALHDALLAAFEAAPEGQALVTGRKNHYNLGRHLKGAAEKAGLGAWADPFQALRRSCLTDWTKALPLPDVAKIAGNSPAVIQKHYHQVRPEVLESVSAPQGPTALEQLSQMPAAELERLLALARGIQVGYSGASEPAPTGLPTA